MRRDCNSLLVPPRTFPSQNLILIQGGEGRGGGGGPPRTFCDHNITCMRWDTGVTALNNNNFSPAQPVLCLLLTMASNIYFSFCLIESTEWNLNRQDNRRTAGLFSVFWYLHCRWQQTPQQPPDPGQQLSTSAVATITWGRGHYSTGSQESHMCVCV